MDVSVTRLRADLATWLDRARRGGDVVVTERGVPVARIVAVDASGLIERLERDGAVTRPARAHRPAAAKITRAASKRSVSTRVSEQRR
jgi:prevent-host-death family protein